MSLTLSETLSTVLALKQCRYNAPVDLPKSSLGNPPKCNQPYMSYLHKSGVHSGRLAVLDLETLALTDSAVILSIGLSVCDTDGYLYMHPKLSEQQEAAVDIDTLSWWSAQSEAAQREALSPVRYYSMSYTLQAVSDFLRAANVDRVVGNGVGFDNVILRNAYKRAGIKIPAALQSNRDFDYRTLKLLFPQVTPPKFSGIPHCALHDAQHEAKHLIMILNYIDAVTNITGGN